MSRRRQRSYHIEAEVTAPAAPPPAPSWLSVLGGVPIAVLMTFLFSGVTFYSVTNYKLSQYDTEIAKLKTQHEQSGPAVQARLDAEATQRTAVRNEFLASQARTAEILSKMDSRLAVSETKQETANQTLNKIADQLQLLNSAARNGRAR